MLLALQLREGGGSCIARCNGMTNTRADLDEQQSTGVVLYMNSHLTRSKPIRARQNNRMTATLESRMNSQYVHAFVAGDHYTARNNT